MYRIDHSIENISPSNFTPNFD